jgi:hypothetical protein
MKKSIYVVFELEAESYEKAEQVVKAALTDPTTEDKKKLLKEHKFVNKVHM